MTICHKLNLKIRGVDFVANLVVLDSKGIDVILVMDWLSKHKVPTKVLRSTPFIPKCLSHLTFYVNFDHLFY
jgi:hypothetical protein